MRSRGYISRLNTQPVPSPVNASTPSSRAAPHDSGPLWFAIPSTYETFTHTTLPVLPAHWNKIEHRLFSFISSNWRGEPLRDYETIVNLIAETTTAKGLTVTCRLDRRKYPTGRKVTAEEMNQVISILTNSMANGTMSSSRIASERHNYATLVCLRLLKFVQSNPPLNRWMTCTQEQHHYEQYYDQTGPISWQQE